MTRIAALLPVLACFLSGESSVAAWTATTTFENRNPLASAQQKRGNKRHLLPFAPSVHGPLLTRRAQQNTGRKGWMTAKHPSCLQSAAVAIPDSMVRRTDAPSGLSVVPTSTVTTPPEPPSTQTEIPSTQQHASERAKVLARWKIRLITKEDSKHIHKIAGSIFVLTSLGVSGYGLYDLVTNGWTQSLVAHGWPLATLLVTMMFSTVVQSWSSIRMACRHRRHQPAVRNTFLSNVVVSILCSVCALWTSPWFPSCLNGRPSLVFFFVTNALGLVGLFDNAVRLPALIASRQRPNERDVSFMDRAEYWKEALVYTTPIFIGLPLFLGIGWTYGLHLDRNAYLLLLQVPGHPHLAAGAVYSTAMSAMGASYSSLIVTLRDKKLISKKLEGSLLATIGLCVVASLWQALRDPGTIPMLMGL